MKVHLARSVDYENASFNSVFDMLIDNSGPIEFVRCKKPIHLKCGADEELRWSEIFNACNDYRKDQAIASKDYLIFLVNSRNEKNWFSSFQPNNSRNIFIQTSDWEIYIDAPREYPIAFQVLENILQVLMFQNPLDDLEQFHDPAIGCINDMCSWKTDVSFKFRTADICPDCLDSLCRNNVSEETLRQIVQILEGLRGPMLFRKKLDGVRNSKSSFPFPIAITKRKILTTNEPFRKFLMLLDHFDSMLRCTVVSVGLLTFGDDAHGFFEENQLLSRPSLGHWLSALNRIMKEGKVRGQETYNILDSLALKINSVVQVSEKEEIVGLRNEKRGHGYCDCNNSNYISLFENHAPVIMSIEQMLKPLYARFRWYYSMSINIPEPGTFDYSVKNLSGSHPDFEEETLAIRATNAIDVPPTEVVFAYYEPTEQCISLNPYVLYSECPKCSHNRVLVTDGELYLDPYVGHRVNIASAG